MKNNPYCFHIVDEWWEVKYGNNKSGVKLQGLCSRCGQTMESIISHPKPGINVENINLKDFLSINKRTYMYVQERN